MSRIAKADVYKALSLAAKTIIDAGGSDGRTSRADMKAALKGLPKEQKALADIFFRFVDARDFKKGAQVTKSDVDKAVAYAKKSMVAKYDLNDNGLSKAEIAKMSLTGRRAVDLAKALKKAAADENHPLPPLAPPRIDEGYSEPAEIAAAGQVPRDWVPEAHVNAGVVTHAGGQYTGIDTPVPLTAEQREVATAAMGVIWDRVFVHRQYRDQDVVDFGNRSEGTLKVGEFRRGDDGKTYLVADWRDVDDASFTLYFERVPDGRLRLAIEQFNN